MKPNTTRRALEIVEDALALPVSDQHRFADQHCGVDAKLRREVEAMLTLDRTLFDEILPERSPQSHVEYLYAATNPQDRFVGFEK